MVDYFKVFLCIGHVLRYFRGFYTPKGVKDPQNTPNFGSFCAILTKTCTFSLIKCPMYVLKVPNLIIFIRQGVSLKNMSVKL